MSEYRKKLIEVALWGKHAQSTKLELNLLSRHYSLIVDEEVDIQDPESGPLYVEAWDPTEEDLDAINEGLQRRAHEGGRVLKASAVRITSRLGLLWVQGSAGAEEIQISTNVDYQSTFASELLDPLRTDFLGCLQFRFTPGIRVQGLVVGRSADNRS